MESLDRPFPEFLGRIVLEYMASNIILFLLLFATRPETMTFGGYEQGEKAHFFQELLSGYGSFHVK